MIEVPEATRDTLKVKSQNIDEMGRVQVVLLPGETAGLLFTERDRKLAYLALKPNAVPSQQLLGRLTELATNGSYQADFLRQQLEARLPQ